MKKISLFLALVLALSLLAGCGQSGGESASDTPEAAAGTSDIDSLKTIGDVLALEGAEFRQSAAYDNVFIYVFDLDGTIYRVFAPMSDDVFTAIMDLEYDEDHDAKFNELVSPLEIDRCENLSEQIPPQEELDKLVGKTGADLLDDGWSCSGYMLDTMEFWMDYGMFEYTVAFDGSLEMSDDFDEYEAIRPLTVKSVVYSDLGNATNLEEDEMAAEA